MPRGWSLGLGAAQGSRLHREQRYHPRCLAWMPLAWHRSAFPVPRSASPPNSLVLGVQGVAVGWEKGRMAHGGVTGLQSSREEYLLHTRSRGCRSSLLQLVLSCTFRKYQRNGTWHVCEAKLVSRSPPHLQGDKAPWRVDPWGDVKDTAHPLWARFETKPGCGWRRATLEKRPRWGRNPDVVVMRAVPAEAGRGSAQGTVGSLQPPGAGVGS